jgi:hypothetical protein
VKIEIRPLSEISPYEKNARKIPQRAIDKVAASLEAFGWQQPIVVDKHGVIIVGHVRRLAALQLGWTEAPVHIADKLTPAQIRAYRLMDNRSNAEATFDLDLLGPELAELSALSFDLSLPDRQVDTHGVIGSFRVSVSSTRVDCGCGDKRFDRVSWHWFLSLSLVVRETYSGTHSRRHSSIPYFAELRYRGESR